MTTDATTGNAEALQGLSILLVEDNPGDIRLVEKRLEHIDNRLIGGVPDICEAADLQSAIEDLANSDFDIVLLDLGLPDSYGLDTLSELRPHSLRIPIVVLTGLDNDDVAFRAVEEGAQDFLKKDSLDGESLARSIRYAIERNRRKLKADVIETATVPMMLVDITGRQSAVVFCNAACQRLTGHRRRQWLRRGLRVLKHDNNGILSRIGPSAVRDVGGRTTIQVQTQREDGTEFWCSIDAIPLNAYDGETSHILYSFSDVTDTVQQRSRLADYDRMNTLCTVANGVAHEINNPLAFLTSNIEYVRRRIEKKGVDDIGPIVEALDDALEGTHRVDSVVQDLQQLSGNSEAFEFDLEPVCLRNAIETALTVARNHINDRAKLTCKLEETPPVLGDESKLGQVILNILINAAQAIPAGDPKHNEIFVSTELREEHVVLSVSDTGVGIPADELDRVFEPFFSTKDSTTGTGLGLSISKQILNEFGAGIDLESTVGEGTTVEVMLQRIEA